MSTADHEETNSSLGDSNYDILSNSTFSEDDRDRSNDSLVSLQRPDDIDSLADTESIAGTTSTGAYTESNLSSSGFLPPTPTYSYASEDGSQGSRTEHRPVFVDEIPLTSPRIEFQEPQDLDESISVIHPVLVFDAEKTEQLVRQFDISGNPSSLVATIRQTMSKQSLSLHEPFRVLYTGNLVAKNDIIEKIGAALAASNSENLVAQAVRRRSSRFNVIPVSSFGGKENPEVALIDSFGLELVVDECTFAKNKRGAVNDEIHLHLNERFWCQSRRGENGLQMDAPLHWRPPHIGIFFCSESDTSLVRQTRHFARSFLQRHKIPFITISQNLRAIQQSETWSIDEDALHMCLESDHEIIKRLPVDLTTFLNIDASQMNRNLAQLTQGELSDLNQSTTSQTTAIASGSASSTLLSESEKTKDSSAHNDPRYMKYSKDRATVVLVTLCLAFAFVLVGTILNVAFFKFVELSRNSEPLIHIITSAPQIQSPTEIPVSSATTSTTSAITALSTLAAPPSSLSVGNLDLASLLFDPKNAANETDKFKVHILGDSHMIMLPPQRFNLLKSPPKVFVKVEKGTKVLDVKLSKLSDGVYSLALDLNDAYGVMNVSVWTKSKPKVSQKFELDFGTPWLKIVGWRRAADDLSRDLQARWSVATKGATDMQKYVAKNIPKVDQEACNAILNKARLASKQLKEEVTKRGEEVTKDLFLKAGVVSGAVTRVVHEQVSTLRDGHHYYAPFALRVWNDVSKVVQDQQHKLGKVLDPKGEAQDSLRKAQANAKRIVTTQAKRFQERLAERKKMRLEKRAAAKLEKKSKKNGCSKGTKKSSKAKASSKAKKNR